jgi:hypothetical protein
MAEASPTGAAWAVEVSAVPVRAAALKTAAAMRSGLLNFLRMKLLDDWSNGTMSRW